MMTEQSPTDRNTALHEILSSTFGHSSFRFDQLNIIEDVLDGKDTIAIMPTGGGKSMCYQVPALYSDGVTIVVSPLISLMEDQVMGLAVNGVEAGFLNSSQSLEQRRESERKICSGEIKIVYVSPEGLLSGSALSVFHGLRVSLIAIDEAHCVSQWGHEFRKDYTRLGELKSTFPTTPFLALTATADSKTRLDMADQLRLNSPKTYVSSFDRPNIKYSICERDNEVAQLQQFIKENHDGETGIVYCLSRKKVEKTADELNKLGLHAVAYHAGMSPKHRTNAQKAFNRDEGIIVVATIAFGMGIDRPDVRFVAHLDLPKSIEGYYQETGRAGRDGNPSSAWMVYGLQDVIKLSQMLETTDASESYKKVARMKLDSMLSLCETADCRRQYLLGYFEEEGEKFCGNCDACLNPAETWDATVDAQKVLSSIYRTGQMFGAAYIIDVLRGSKNSKVLERGHDKVSTYAIGKDESKKHWNTIIRQLLNQKYIGIKNWEYRNLCLTPKSGEILRGEKSLLLRKVKNKVKINNKNTLKHINASHGNDDLFEVLRAARKVLADENNVPPFMIFADRTLHDMCSILPKNKTDFLMVNGVGKKKCELYSSNFLEAINEYLN